MSAWLEPLDVTESLIDSLTMALLRRPPPPEPSFDRSLLPEDLGVWLAKPHGHVHAWLTAGHLWIDIRAAHAAIGIAARIPLGDLRFWWRDRVAGLIRELRADMNRDD